jgi:hypothetical protein
MDIRKSLHGRDLGIGPTGELVINKDTGEQSVLGLSANKIITSAQVLALFTTAIAVIPTPGAGLIAVPRLAQVYKPAGTAYAVGAGSDLVLKYTNAAGAQCSSVIETVGFLDQATAQNRFVGMPGATGATAADVNGVADAAVVLHCLSANPTTGTSLLSVRVWYDIITSTLPIV